MTTAEVRSMSAAGAEENARRCLDRANEAEPAEVAALWTGEAILWAVIAVRATIEEQLDLMGREIVSAIRALETVER